MSPKTKKKAKRKPQKSKKRALEKQEEFKVNLPKHRPERYQVYARQGARTLYWLVLLSLAVCNFLLFLALVPLMFILNETQLFLVIGAIALLFGLIFNFLIRDIEHLKPKHHVFAGIFIPVLSLINIAILVFIENVARQDPSSPERSILYASFLYVGLFALPYLVSPILGSVVQKK